MRRRTRTTIGTRLHKVYFWLWDGMDEAVLGDKWWNRPDPHGRLDRAADLLERLVQRPALWLLCKVYGHEPMPDNCGRPEHDLCVWCHRLTPHAAIRDSSSEVNR